MTGPIDLHVWRVALDDDETVSDASLSCAERDRARRFRSRVHGRRFVAGRDAVRRVLAARLHCAPSEVPLETGAHGKPSVRDARVAFNLSHSDDDALIVLAEAATEEPVSVGVDLEHVRSLPDAAALAERHFHPDERVRAGADADGFLRVWTCKEAVVKALGLGLGVVDTRTFSVTAVSAYGSVPVVVPGYGIWYVRSLALPSNRPLHAAVAADRPIGTIRVERLESEPARSA